MSYREDCYEMWRTCFTDTEQYMDFYFNVMVPNNEVLTLYGDGKREEVLYFNPDHQPTNDLPNAKLTSMIHLNPYQLQFGNRECVLHYIVGVATAPVHRRRGQMRRLLEEAFQLMSDRGEPITYLMPANERIYLPFGFRYAYTQHRIDLDIRRLERNARKSHRITRDAAVSSASINDHTFGIDEYRTISWDACPPAEREAACSCANQIIGGDFNAYVVRTPEYYERIAREMEAADGDLLLVYPRQDVEAENLAIEQASQPIGIVSYMYEYKKLEVTEVICEPKDALAVLQQTYHYASTHNQNHIRAIVCLESAHISLPRAYIVRTERKPIIMMRIVNVESFLSHLPGKEGEQYEFYVEDKWIPQNNGAYRVVWEKEGVRVDKLNTTHEKILTIEELFLLFRDRWRVYLNEIV